MGVKQTKFDDFLCPLNVSKNLPSKSHNFEVLSNEAVAIPSPVRLKQTFLTNLLCTVNVTKHLPCKSHNFAVLSNEAVAIASLVGLKVRQLVV